MKKYNLSFEYYDDGVYDMGEVLGELDNYFGMSFRECIEHIKEIDILEKKDIFKKKSGEFYFDKKLLDIVNINYNYLIENFNILRNKSFDYILLFNYLDNLSENCYREVKYEDILKECNIIHVRSVLTGLDVKRLLVGFGNTLKKLDEVVEMINNTDSYDVVLIDSFSKMFPEKIYPGKSIVLENEDISDKTSICRKKIRRIS